MAFPPTAKGFIMNIDRRAALGSSLAGMLLTAAPAAAAGAPAAPRTIRPLAVKGVTIGAGQPKLIVSVTEKTPAAALERTRQLAAMAEVDLIEYRIDHLADHADPARVALSVAEVAAASGAKPLLLTFRTKAEGGEAAIAPEAYAALYAAALRHGGADLIDLEFALCAHPAVKAVFQQAKAAGKPVITSYHNFHMTPTVAMMVEKLQAMQAFGADIPKIAVMPRDAGDTLALLEATWTMHSRYADRPLLTMSMNGTGAISRVAGEIFGSALTFGAVGAASAPGQIDARHLRPMLETLAASVGTPA
jgi:3-dehydroquinate dehydratase I